MLAAGLAGLSAQTNSLAGRPLSLTDCFTEALKHNLNLQIVQTVPQISLYNLQSAYGGYDPQFTLSGTHSYNDSGAYFSGGQLVLPTIDQANTFNSAFTGATPWGMNYNLGGNITEQHIGKTIGTNFLSGDNSSGAIGLSVTQPLLKNLWIDGNRLTILIAKNQLKISEQALRSQIIATVTAVENAYYELIFARDNVNVEEEALALSQTQLDQDRQRVQIGSVAERDGTIEQDESQVAGNRAALIAALSTLGTDQRVLKNLLTDQYSKWFEADLQPTLALAAPLQLFDLQDSWNKGMSSRPDLIQARLSVEQQGIQLKFYRNQLFPEVDLIGSYGFNGSGNEYRDSFSQMNDGSRPFYSYGGQLTLPLSNARARNNLKAGKATEKQLLLQLKQLEQNIMVEIDNAIGVARSAYESVDASRQARIYAEAALDAEQKKYAVGKSTTFTVLTLQSKLTGSRSLEIRALANYNQALANLAAAEGSTLQRHNLEVEVK